MKRSKKPYVRGTKYGVKKANRGRIKKSKKAGHRLYLSTNDVRILNQLEQSYDERIKLPFQIVDIIKDDAGVSHGIPANYNFMKSLNESGVSYGAFGCLCLSELFKATDVGEVGKVNWTGVKVNLHLSNIVSTVNGVQNAYSGDLIFRVVVFRSKKYLTYTDPPFGGINPIASKMVAISDPQMFQTPVSSYVNAEIDKEEVKVIKTFSTRMPAGKVGSRRYPIWLPYRKEFRFCADQDSDVLSGYYHNFYLAVFVDDYFCNPVANHSVPLGQMRLDGFNYYTRCISSKRGQTMSDE